MKEHKISPANLKRLKISANSWQVQTAKSRFSELFRLARTEGPQLITRQGRDGVVMLPVEQFELLVARARQPESLLEFLRKSPLVGLEVEFERDKDPGRDFGI
ncbi:MAG TPA: type II toxin-antitoxin system prevent-host-death family antitoxin [Trichormus sp.]|jgi:prevent-host-death family protein